MGPAGAGAHASGPAAAAAASVYAEAKPEQDEYAKEMLARLAGHQAAASPDFGGPPAKRLKTEEAVKLEPKQEEAAAAGGDSVNQLELIGLGVWGAWHLHLTAVK